MISKDSVYAVGFDLDGTLYQSTPEIDLRVRTKIAEKILGMKPDLQNVEKARQYFDERYAALHSGTGVLQESGYSCYSNASKIMDECLVTANVVDLIKKDERLVEIIERICGKYVTFLLTSSPEESANAKLTAIGIMPTSFDYKFCSDTPNVGHKHDSTAFVHAINLTSFPPNKHVYIGDRKANDILPAKNLGMQTIAVWSDIPEADVSIDHIHKLEEILLQTRK